MADNTPRTTFKTFSLAQLLTAVTVASVLIAILIPVIARAREEDRSTRCQNNLRQFGLGFMLHAEQDPQSRLCTGAFDYLRDGCPDTWGWVADLKKIGAAVPNDLRCPANPVQGLEPLNDLLLGNDVPLNGAPASRLDSGACMAFISGAAKPGTPARRQIVAQMVRDGFNSNYSSSWAFARTDPKLDATAGAPVTRAKLQGFAGTIGGLSLRAVEAFPILSSAIPLLGDAAQDLETPANLRGELANAIAANAPLGKSFGAGPSHWNSVQGIVAMSTGTNVIAAVNGDILPIPIDDPLGPPGNATHGGADRLLWLQDLRNWRSVHHLSNTAFVNVLMADGSVQQFQDMNADGYLNPGFPVIPLPANSPPVGYADAVPELPPTALFAGPFVDWTIRKVHACEW